jgi:CHAT domain-containing protein/Tfp pilus assembly protein PilF
MKQLLFCLALFCCCQNSLAQGRFVSVFTDESEIALDSLGDDAFLKGNYKLAITYTETLLAKIEVRSGTQDSSYGFFINYLGFLNMYAGNHSIAEKLLLQGERIYTNIYGKEHEEVANALSGLGRVYKRMGHYTKAEEKLLEVKAINAKLYSKDDRRNLVTLGSLASLYYYMGRYEEAEEQYLENKKRIAKTLGVTHKEYGTVLGNLAALYYVNRRHEEAENLFLEALNVIDKVYGKKHPRYASQLMNLAALCFSMERYEEGEKFYLEAQGIRAETLGVEHPTYANGLNMLASSYRDRGRYEEAIVIFSRIRILVKKRLGVNSPAYAKILFDFSNTYYEMGRYQDALLLQLESLEITEHILGVRHDDYINCFNVLAMTYLKLNNTSKARECLSKGLQAVSGLNISMIITEEWKDSLATANYSSIVHIRQALRNLRRINLLLEKEQAPEVETRQLILTKLAHQLFERTRKLHTSSASKLRTLNSGDGWTSKGLYLLDRAGQVEEAFDLAEASKSVLLLEATKSEKAYRLGNLPDSLMLEENALLKERDQLQANIIKKRPQVERDSLRVLLNTINQNIHSFVNNLKQDYPSYVDLKYNNDNATLSEIQALLKPKTALLEYVITDSILYLFYMDKNKYKMLNQPINRSTLKTKISQLHGALSNYELLTTNKEKSYEAYVRPAHWFYEKLIAPIMEGASGIDHLIIVPDGELGHLPFETFLLQAANQGKPDYTKLDYLVKHFKISYNYSATLWKEDKQREKPINNGQVLAMAGNYDLELDNLKKGLRLSNYYRNRAGLQPLEAAQREVRVLSQEFQGYFGFDEGASERLFKEKAADYAVIHLAMHGSLDYKHPILSSLIFTEDGDSVENSLLQAYEISSLKLNADLVVLSACETGFGTFEKGNGIASLARSFMYAGASSMVVTLWQVNDYVTAEIMKDLYSNLSDGMTKSEALQQAKLNFMQGASDIGQHPAFWSPFVLIGNDAPIQLLRKSHGLFWGMVLAGLFALGSLGFVFWRKRNV